MPIITVDRYLSRVAITFTSAAPLWSDMESTTVDSYDEVTFDVIREVAERENCDELDLPPLSDTIDPDVLDALPESSKLQFDYLGYEITVENGAVTVYQ